VGLRKEALSQNGKKWKGRSEQKGEKDHNRSSQKKRKKLSAYDERGKSPGKYGKRKKGLLS